MRIAMLGWEFPPFKSGGLGVHCFELTLRLANMGHEVDFFMPVVGQALKSPHPNIRLFEVAETILKPYLSFSKKGQRATYGNGLSHAVGVYNSQVAKMVLEKNAEKKYDIIHGHDWLTVKGACEASSKSLLPHVHTFHSTEYDRTSYPWDFVLDIEKQGARESDLIIAVSKRTKEQIARLGANPNHIRVVYNGVDSSKFKNCPELAGGSPMSRLKTGNKRLVLFLGRLTEQKGPVQFLHAAKKVVTKNPDVQFIMAGTGELLPLLINMSIELGLQNNVRFLGFVPEEEQRRIYSACELYVMPSTSEPFGITALEAMASGIPVIVSKTSGVSEVVKSAVRVDFWDINGMAQKMLAILSYPSLRSAMISLECSDVQELTWEKTASETSKVYDEAIAMKKAVVQAQAGKQ
jgi:glycogen synthase